MSMELRRKYLENPDTYATTLLTIVYDVYGTDVLEWTPETLRLEVMDDFNVEMPKINVDKIMAAVSIITSDDFYKNLSRFITLCNILSGSEFNPLVFDPADSIEIAWGITEAMLLYPPDDDEPFTNEIRHYIGATLASEGIGNPPDVLRIAKYDPNMFPDPLSNFAEDPEMYSAAYKTNEGKAAEILESVRENILELVGELESLNLKTGNTKDMMKRLKATLFDK